MDFLAGAWIFKVTVAWFAAKDGVPGEATVNVQVPAPVAVISVVPFTRHGPDSEMVVGAPDPVVANNCSVAFAGAGTVAPAGQAALPCTPNEMGSAPNAGFTSTIWFAVPLALEFDAEKLAVMIWLPEIVGVHGAVAWAFVIGWLPEMLNTFPLTFVVNAALPCTVTLLAPLTMAATSVGTPTVKDPGSFSDSVGAVVNTWMPSVLEEVSQLAAPLNPIPGL